MTMNGESFDTFGIFQGTQNIADCIFKSVGCTNIIKNIQNQCKLPASRFQKLK